MCLLHPISAGTIPSSTEQGEHVIISSGLNYYIIIYTYVLSVVVFFLYNYSYVYYVLCSISQMWVGTSH